MTSTLVVGAVAYTANVVPIWEGIRQYFRAAPVETDYVLFSNYGRQVDALLRGDIDIAWNTNLAWVRTVGITNGACRALAMRDTDVAFSSVFVSRAGAGLDSARDLKGRRLALGSRDSAQAAILPLYYLAHEGMSEGDFTVIRFDSDVGKHGDTGRTLGPPRAGWLPLALRGGRGAGHLADLVSAPRAARRPSAPSSALDCGAAPGGRCLAR